MRASGWTIAANLALPLLTAPTWVTAVPKSVPWPICLALWRSCIPYQQDAPHLPDGHTRAFEGAAPHTPGALVRSHGNARAIVQARDSRISRASSPPSCSTTQRGGGHEHCAEIP